MTFEMDDCLLTGDIDYYQAFPALVDLHKALDSSEVVQRGSVLSWYYFFHRWLQKTGRALISVCSEVVQRGCVFICHLLYSIGITFSTTVCRIPFIGTVTSVESG